MNTPMGMIIVIATIARPESTMQARYSLCMVRRYRAFMPTKRPPQFALWRPSFPGWRLLLVPDALDQRGVLGAVLVAHRLGRLVEGFLVGRHELDARRLQLGGGL